LREPARLFVIRHGETAWNAETRMQGQLDTELNDTGRWQAELLALALRAEPIDTIFASDLQRTLQTAAPIARALGRSVQPEPGLRERAFGAFEGHTYADIDRRWPDGSARWRSRDRHFAPEGGESLDAFNARCIEVADRLCAAQPGCTMVWVTHGGVLDCLYRAATRVALDAPRTWSLANAAINRLLHSDQGLMLVGWGDVQHLETPGPGVGLR
jgi:probable phosphoglycerate mutase